MRRGCEAQSLSSTPHLRGRHELPVHHRHPRGLCGQAAGRTRRSAHLWLTARLPVRRFEGGQVPRPRREAVLRSVCQERSFLVPHRALTHLRRLLRTGLSHHHSRTNGSPVRLLQRAPRRDPHRTTGPTTTPAPGGPGGTGRQRLGCHVAKQGTAAADLLSREPAHPPGHRRAGKRCPPAAPQGLRGPRPGPGHHPGTPAAAGSRGRTPPAGAGAPVR